MPSMTVKLLPIALADAAEHWRALSHAIHDR